MSKKAWGGRFAEELNVLAARFSASVDVDKRLAPQDITGSIAHANMLAAQGIIDQTDADAIVRGLQSIAKQIEAGNFDWDASKEDVHMNIESALTAAIGDAGGRLHTARSRNDQVATDMRLWARGACADTMRRIDGVLSTLVTQGEAHLDALMPGYTHLQRAQPTRLSHHLLAWAHMLERDHARLADASKRLNRSPLGSAALAGTTFDIDRDHTSAALGFDGPMHNSLDAVADRDFLIECVSALSICAVHMSRIAEELVLWSAQEFGFVEMSDGFTTGSSIMPQKKNPDMAELIRGKTGRVVGSLVNLIVMLKGLPLAYNRDLQEDKAPVFDAFDTVNDSLDVLAGALGTATFHTDRMREALGAGFLDATEVADWLADHGVPFREAHHVAGRLVKRAIDAETTLSELDLQTYKAEHDAFDESIFAALDMEAAVERRNVTGGPAKAQVKLALAELSQRLQKRA